MKLLLLRLQIGVCEGRPALSSVVGVRDIQNVPARAI